MGVWIETRGRGEGWTLTRVTPCMGVWIETSKALIYGMASSRHTLYGCVDWNLLSENTVTGYKRHTLYGCVDWNSRSSYVTLSFLVTPCMGVWIET